LTLIHDRGAGRIPTGLVSWLILFVVCLGFWVVMSGLFDALHLGSGVLAAALVATLTVGVERRGSWSRAAAAAPLFRASPTWGRFLVYLPWLLFQMVRSAVQVAAVVVHPRMPIRPTLIRLRSGLRGDLEQTTFGNSITLTPGTVTLDVQDGEFVVHALTEAAAEDLLAGTMERRVAWTFGSEPW
jgi:multicomponent Na+:H+ antiporter subunit E